MATPRQDPQNGFHYRYAEISKGANGKLAASYTSRSVGEGAHDINVLMATGEVITKDSVQEWFSDIKITANADEVNSLTKYLNLMRVTRPREHLPDPPEYKRVVEAVHTLAKDTPVLLNLLLSNMSTVTKKHDVKSVVKATSVTNDLIALITAAENLRAHPEFVPQGRPNDQRSLWHRDVMFIAIVLEQAAERTGQQVGLGKPDGRGVRFIVRALRATKAHMGATPDSVAQAIKRYRARLST